MPSLFQVQFTRALLCAILLSLSASRAQAQYPPPAVGVPYDAPPQTVIPRAGSIGRALTPPTYYRSAPQMVPTTVYRPVTAYHPVTGQPYTRWTPATTLDVETRRVETPLPGYGAPFAAYRPAAPTPMPVYSPPTPRMNVQGWVDPYSGNVSNAPVPGAYSSFRPALSVAPAYAVGRPVMGAPVVDHHGAWPRRATPMAVQYPPITSAAPAPIYRGPVYNAPIYSAPMYSAPASAPPAYAAPTYSAPGGASPAYSAPATISPGASDPYYSPRPPASTAPADVQPSLRSSSSASPSASSAGAVSSARPLVSAQEPGAAPEVNWPRFLPDRTRQPAPATPADDSPRTSNAPLAEAPRAVERSKPAYEYDSETRPLRDPSRIPSLEDHRAPPLLEPRSAGVTAPIRRLTLTPRDNVTGHTANPAAR